MKLFHRLAGILAAFCLMIVLFVTSVEAVVYWTPGYFEQEYTKYNVLDQLPSMTMADLLDVTDEMMDYLKGKREDLHVTTVMGGEEREFFNAREIAHMEDVQVLFLKAMSLRRICLSICILCLALLLITKAPVRRVLPPSIKGLITAAMAFACGATKAFSPTKPYVWFNIIITPATVAADTKVPRNFQRSCFTGVVPSQ